MLLQDHAARARGAPAGPDGRREGNIGMLESLAGRSVVIVGATSGIGEAAASLFAAQGAHLTLAGRRAGELQRVGEKLADEHGCSALAVPCDVRDRQQVQALADAAEARYGRIDLLLFATGINIKERLLGRLTPDHWDNLIATNLNGAFYTTYSVLPVMRRQKGGLIIYISSISGKWNDLSGVAYQASKRGLDGLAGGIRLEERETGIRTSCVYPGLVDTPLILNRPYKTPEEEVAQALQPEDVAEACLYIARMPERCHIPELVIRPTRP